MQNSKRKVGDRVFFHSRSGGSSLYREGVISQVIYSQAGGVMQMQLGSIHISAGQPTYRVTCEEEYFEELHTTTTLVVAEEEIIPKETAVALRLMEAP